MVNSTNWGGPSKTSTDWLGKEGVLLATEASELILNQDTTEIILDGVEDTTGTATNWEKEGW